MCTPPELGRRSVVNDDKSGIHAPSTFESRTGGNVGYRKARLIEQSFCALDAPAQGDLQRRCFEMLPEQAGEMARADAEPFGKLIDAGVIERTLIDHA
jgi:hypothetical protein